MSKPPLGLLSEAKIQAMMTVLITNRDIVEAYQAKGVDYMDIAVLCGYAAHWVRINKVVQINLPDEAV